MLAELRKYVTMGNEVFFLNTEASSSFLVSKTFALFPEMMVIETPNQWIRQARQQW